MYIIYARTMNQQYKKNIVPTLNPKAKKSQFLSVIFHLLFKTFLLCKAIVEELFLTFFLQMYR